MSVRLLTGDCRAILPSLRAESVQCVVTSPPYYALRDYGVEGQIGLEDSPEQWVDKLVAVFREVRRVLRDDGTLWLNCGDAYVSGQGGRQTAVGELPPTIRRDRPEPRPRNDVDVTGWGERAVAPRNYPGRGTGLKPKDLYGLPWMLAFGLRADGWYLRADCIWHKPNPMPESVDDRPTKAHEYLFLLTKNPRYYYDADAIREPHKPESLARYEYGLHTTAPQDGRIASSGCSPNNVRALGRSAKMLDNIDLAGRNKRTVWTINPEPYAEAHFATFPAGLVQPCILAGCPVGGTVLDPFGGSGTVGEVATALGRHAVLIELNPAYVALAERRCAQGGLFAGIENGTVADVDARQGCLF